MKPILLMATLLAATACVSAREFDLDKAYSKCESIKTVTIRDRCIADAIADAGRERLEQSDAVTRQEEEAEQREINRVIAGAPQDG